MPQPSHSTVGFVLVHGGFHGGWCWDALRPLLTAPSIAVELPGRSGLAEEHATISYDDWVESATSQSRALETDGIILVGHSMAGITIPQAAIRLADRLRGIVFVAAVIPPEGESFAAHYAGSPVVAPTWDVPPPQVAAGFLGTGMSDTEISALLARLNAEPAGPALAPISRKGVPNVPALYIRAESDVTGLGQKEADRLKADFPSLEMVDAPGGHNLMMTRPQALAAILNSLLPG